MGLDVPVPDPPDLTNRGAPRGFDWEYEAAGPTVFHREELDALLRDGAWQEGFNEWAEYTELDEDHVRAVADLDLFRAFDFYWDPDDGRLRYDAPSVPDDWRDRDATASFDSSTVSMIDADLQDLGRAVQEILEDYVDRSDEVSTHHWAEETYGDRGE